MEQHTYIALYSRRQKQSHHGLHHIDRPDYSLCQESRKEKFLCRLPYPPELRAMCTGFALAIVNIIPVLGWLISIISMFALLILWGMELLNAINEKEAPVPVLGNFYSKWFSGIQ